MATNRHCQTDGEGGDVKFAADSLCCQQTCPVVSVPQTVVSGAGNTLKEFFKKKKKF